MIHQSKDPLGNLKKKKKRFWHHFKELHFKAYMGVMQIIEGICLHGIIKAVRSVMPENVSMTFVS